MESIQWKYAELKLDIKTEWAYWIEPENNFIDIRVSTKISEFYNFLNNKGKEGWEAYSCFIHDDKNKKFKIYTLKKVVN